MEACERYQELLPAYLDGEVTAEQKAILEAHLQKCPECRVVANRLKALTNALRSLPRITTSSEFDVALRTRIRLEERHMSRPKVVLPSFARVPAWGVVATAAAILLFVFLWPEQREGHRGGSAGVGRRGATWVQTSGKRIEVARRDIRYVMEQVPVKALQGEGSASAQHQSTLIDSSTREESMRLVASRIYRVSF
jgi:hypothetical protein